jgi:hypothetical protein
MTALAHARIDRIVGDGTPHLNQKETGRVLRRSSGWVNDMVKAGRLPAVPLGNAKVISRAAVVSALVYGV